MLKILTVVALLTIPLAGLSLAHTSESDVPTKCTPYQGDYQDPYLTYRPQTPVPPEHHSNRVYVILGTNSGTNVAPAADASKIEKDPAKYNDGDRAYPVSIWVESKARDGLQTVKYSCKHDDGHDYLGNDPQYLPRAPDTFVAGLS